MTAALRCERCDELHFLFDGLCLDCGDKVARAARRTPVGGVVRHAVARESGATITVERTGPGSWLEQEPGWATVCLNHSRLCMHDTRELAESHAVVPSGWCEDCRAITEGNAPRIRGKVA